MKIKIGDYAESLHGMVGVVKTVGSTVTVGDNEQFAFDWEITRPGVRYGDRRFFSGSESDLWLHYKRIGPYENPQLPFLMKKSGGKEKNIEPFTLMKEQRVNGWMVTCETDGTQTAEYGKHNVMVTDIPDNAALALKINEIIDYLNTERK